MDAALKSFLHNALLYVLNVGLYWLSSEISGAVGDFIKNDIFLSVSILAVGLFLLFISYRRHEKRVGEASDEALRLANNSATHRSEWVSLIEQSSQAWPWEGRAIDFAINMTTWIAACFIVLVFCPRLPELAPFIYPVLTLITTLSSEHLKSRRDYDKFEEDLKAANEGRLQYSDESPQEEISVKTSAEDFVADLPKEIMTEAAKSIFRFK